jgi:hypothetical protein
MKIKPTIIKTSKHNLIAYRDGYICIDGNYVIACHLVILDNPEMQKKVLLDEPFCVNSGNYSEHIPDLKSVIPEMHTNQIQLIDTELNTNLRPKCRVYYNPLLNYFTYFNLDYLKQVTKTGLKLNLVQQSKHSGAGHYDNDLKCLFYIMPVTLRNCFLEKIDINKGKE